MRSLSSDLLKLRGKRAAKMSSFWLLMPNIKVGKRWWVNALRHLDFGTLMCIFTRKSSLSRYCLLLEMHLNGCVSKVVLSNKHKLCLLSMWPDWDQSGSLDRCRLVHKWQMTQWSFAAKGHLACFLCRTKPSKFDCVITLSCWFIVFVVWTLACSLLPGGAV